MGTASDDILDYIAAMPQPRRDVVEQMRALIQTHLPQGYVEAFNWGMITYEVPMEASGQTYNGKPLMFVALANQKNHIGLYLCGLYCIVGAKTEFAEKFKAAGKKLDMGAACLRFKTFDQLDLPAVISAISDTPMDVFINHSKCEANPNAKNIGGKRKK